MARKDTPETLILFSRIPRTDARRTGRDGLLGAALRFRFSVKFSSAQLYATLRVLLARPSQTTAPSFSDVMDPVSGYAQSPY